MGNSLPLPCACHHEANGEHEGATAGARKRRRKKLAACRNATTGRAARARHVVPVLDMPEEGGGNGGKKEEWPGCRVEPISCGAGDDGRVRVKIVMKRKDIAELVARLEQRGATDMERGGGDARTAVEVHTDLGGGRGSSGTMSPRREAWKPQLSIIPENY
ncbi:hypothetical protein BS78_09G230000 [Paspalum vaginatum]|nr:hypothetical protein BS78_09G230000 [Paspalum vaginatum]